MNKTFVMLGAAVMWAMMGIGGAVAYEKQKVVYHINYDDPKTQAGALRNIQNHINAVGKENLELRVVMHGNGLSLLLDPDMKGEATLAANATPQMQAKVAGLKDQGITFKVCANTLKGKKVTDPENQLYDFTKADIVPSGVAELAALQAQGFTYIKP
ncbi:MAG: DsrE family protein [Gammaproteobacteria bacterium]|nr:DsrE family protein [Gammaproteobacteria bacterium]